MQTLLQGLPGVYLYLVYILITGKTDQEHLTNLLAVLQKLPTASMKPKPEKSLIMVYKVEVWVIRYQQLVSNQPRRTFMLLWKYLFQGMFQN